MRGEHPWWVTCQDSCTGSSPHARGTQRLFVVLGVVVGIIPACAGNTGTLPSGVVYVRDHPRMRGEHLASAAAALAAAGSSPHARGTRCAVGADAGHAGIIPACAGNTTLRYMLPQDDWDHPRMRGEHVATMATVVSLEGSSPHARGTLGRRTRQEQ